VEGAFCTKKSFFFGKFQSLSHQVFIEKISKSKIVCTMAARTARRTPNSTSGTITFFLNVQLKKKLHSHKDLDFAYEPQKNQKFSLKIDITGTCPNPQKAPYGTIVL
jgi:hypothetical protein